MGEVFQSEREMVDILLKAMPGGIVAGYATDGYPICFVNDKYLEMLGYDTYEEYKKDVQGLAINSIHPEDREMVKHVIDTSYEEDEQHGIEYRIRNKTGNYIYVYDIGKKVMNVGQKDMIVCVLFDMTEHVETKMLLAKESVSDELTQIFNRRGGIRMIEEHLNNGELYTFAIFDIDNFKMINDEYNHQAGDIALKKFSELMSHSFDKQTILARLGGDEFIAFIPKQLSKEHMTEVLQHFQSVYKQFIEENYPRSRSSVSIGCVTGKEVTTFDQLYQTADALMYQMKKNGKNGCRIEEL